MKQNCTIIYNYITGFKAQQYVALMKGIANSYKECKRFYYESYYKQ